MALIINWDIKLSSLIIRVIVDLVLAGLLHQPVSLERLDYVLPSYYSYRLTLGKLTLVSNRLPSNTPLLGQTQETLDDWAMNLSIYLPAGFYWQSINYLTPYIIIVWLLVFILLCITHLGFQRYHQSLIYGLKEAIENGTMDVTLSAYCCNQKPTTP